MTRTDTHPDFATAIHQAHELIRTAPVFNVQRWQGVDVSKKPEMATHEIRHFFIDVAMPTEQLDYYRQQVQPNLPWADDHFLERACGQPINPGIQWKHWPYALSADKFLEGGKFNHNYMERYWPKNAGLPVITETAKEYADHVKISGGWGDGQGPAGIYHSYGDLNDVVSQLVRDPTTRQAILPVFFPEDTGAAHGGRVPCSLFYQFLMRDGKMDISYMLRSCDILRHFRDDIYLTVRLLLWVLDECRKRNKQWRLVKPGNFVMLISSLHCFRNDHRQLFGDV